MATTIKHKSTEKGFGPAIFNSEVIGHENDPLVVKKVAKATATLKKVGLPNKILK